MTPKTPRYARIHLPVPITTPFTYAIPAGMETSAVVGVRALVPFGRRMLTGFVTGLSEGPGDVPLSKMKNIAEIIDDEPVFDTHMLELARWVADYYLCSTGDVLKAAMPAGTMVRSRLRVHLTERTPDSPPSLTRLQRDVYDTIAANAPMLMRTLDRSMGRSTSQVVRALESKGLVHIEREITEKSAGPRTVRHILPTETTDPARISPRAREQRRCAEILAGYPDGCELAEFLERHAISRGVANTLVKDGHARFEERPLLRVSAMLNQEPLEADHPLTAEQEACFNRIMQDFDTGNGRPFLVKGVTGSGKTRLYIEVVREALKRGKGAIILVPEISLTPQTTRFFDSVFTGRVAVLHSAMSPGERFDMWHLVNSGARDVVIGPRSAVFSPMRDPGVIIVDEEHDPSYKQTDTAPRYNARDVAVVRGSLLGVPVLLGSATPSLESWRNAERDRYVRCVLSKRVGSKALPRVVTADMRREQEADNMSSLSRVLRQELAERIQRDEKSIVLINRRGHSTGVQCRECGEVILCPECSVSLTWHSSKGLAVCHLCGHSQIILEHCPACGSSEMRRRGRGTQRIEKELDTIPGARVIRMDSDTTGGHDAHFRLLEEFRKGDANILLGTQMVAKGLDFPEVTLVGIISADSSLYIPDFRAPERTFQLITQVAGRAGRGETPGLVVLQTRTPENYVIRFALEQDYDAFAARELDMRKETGFPPHSRLVLIEISNVDRETARSEVDGITEALIAAQSASTEVLGPVDAPIARVRGRHRFHILLRTASITTLLPLVRTVLADIPAPSSTITVDVDPIDLL